MSIKLSKNNRTIEVPDKLWLDMLSILYLRKRKVFEFFKEFTEQLNQEKFDMNNVTYSQKRKYKK